MLLWSLRCWLILVAACFDNLVVWLLAGVCLLIVEFMLCSLR